MAKRGRKKGTPKTGGRKAGTPNKATAAVKAVAQEYTADAIDVLVQIMRKGEGEPARIAAARELLDRGHGRARQTMKHEGLEPAKLAVVNISSQSEMRALLGQAVTDVDAGDDDDDRDED